MRKILDILPIFSFLLFNEMLAIEEATISDNNNIIQNVVPPDNVAHGDTANPGEGAHTSTHHHAPHTHAHTSAHSHTHAPHTSTHSYTHASRAPHAHTHASHAPHAHTHTHASHAPHAHTHASHTSAHSHASHALHAHTHASHAPHTHAHASHAPHAHTHASHAPHAHTHASHALHAHTHASHTSAHSHTSSHRHTHAPHESAYRNENGYEFPFGVFGDDLFAAGASSSAIRQNTHRSGDSSAADAHESASSTSSSVVRQNEDNHEFQFDFSPAVSNSAEKSKNTEQFVSDYNDPPTLAQLQECPDFSVVCRFTNGHATPNELLHAAMDIMTHFDPEKRPYYVIATQKKMPKRSPDEKSKNAERFVSDYVSNYNDTPTLAQLQECPAFSVVYRFTNGQATPDELLQAALYIDARFNTTTHSFDVMWKIGLSYDGIYRFHKIGRCIMDTRHTEKLNDNDQRVMCDFWQHNFISHTAKEYRLYRARCKNFERKLRAKSGIYLNRFSKDDRILTPMEILQCGIVTRHCFNRSLRKVDEFLSTLVNDEGNYTPLGLQIPPEYQIFIPYHRALVLFEANKSDINTYNRFALNKYNRVEKITSKIIDDNGTFSSEALILTPRQMSLMAYVRGISLFCRRKFAAAAAVFAQFIDDNGENGPLAFALPKHSNGNTGFEPNFNDTINKRGIALVNLRKDAAAVNVLGRLIDAYNQEIAVGEREPEITKWSATVTFMLGVALGNLHRCLDAAHVLFQLIKASGDESALAKCLPLYTRSKARFLLGESLHHLTTTSDGEVICLDNDATMTIPLNNALIAVLSRFLSLDYIDDTEDMSHLKSKRQRVLVRQYLGRAMSKNLDFVGSAAVLSKLINDDGNWDALMAGTHDNAIRSDVIFARVNSLILSDVNTAARVSMAFFNEYGNLKGAISDSLDVVGRIGLRHACVRNLSIARKEIGNEQKTKILNIASKFFKDADVHLEPCPEQFRENTAFVADLTFWYASLRNHFFGYDDQLLQRLLLKFRSDPYSWNTYMFNALWSLDQQDLKNMGTTPMI